MANLMKTVFRLGVAMGILLALASPTVAGSPDADRAAIERAAVEYARDFIGLLKDDPAEAERLGVTAEALAIATSSVVARVHQLDDQFRLDGDVRSLDMAVVETDLWWVILESAGRPQIVVSVETQDGLDSPRAVGLNWIPAEEFADALARVGDPNARVVWVVDDAPLVLGQSAVGLVAMPIANDALVEHLGLVRAPVGVQDYTLALRERLARRVSVGPGTIGLGGGGAASLDPEAAGIRDLIPIGAIVLFGSLALVMGGAARRSWSHRSWIK